MSAPKRSEDERAREFLRQAIELAVASARTGGGPFGAIVVRGDEVLARGANRVTRDADPTAHAEIVAIREACRRLGSFELEGCEVYASSEPCPMCLGALYWARPARVIFASGREAAAAAGFDDAFIYDELARSTDRRDLEMRRLTVVEAGTEFEVWAANPERVEY